MGMVTITGTFTTPGNIPSTADVTFQLQSQLTDSSGNIIWTTEVVRGVLNSSGLLKAIDGSTALQLHSTTDPGLLPVGVLYKVVVIYERGLPWEFYMAVPHDAGSSIDLADLQVLPTPGSIALPNYTSDSQLISWVIGENLSIGTFVMNGTYPTVLQSATVTWPDGSSGTWATDTINTTWQAIDAFHVTHNVSGKTVTQSAITRDPSGVVIIRPTPTVA